MRVRRVRRLVCNQGKVARAVLLQRQLKGGGGGGRRRGAGGGGRGAGGGGRASIRTHVIWSASPSAHRPASTRRPSTVRLAQLTSPSARRPAYVTVLHSSRFLPYRSEECFQKVIVVDLGQGGRVPLGRLVLVHQDGADAFVKVIAL